MKSISCRHFRFFCCSIYDWPLLAILCRFCVVMCIALRTMKMWKNRARVREFVVFHWAEQHWMSINDRDQGNFTLIDVSCNMASSLARCPFGCVCDAKAFVLWQITIMWLMCPFHKCAASEHLAITLNIVICGRFIYLIFARLSFVWKMPSHAIVLSISEIMFLCNLVQKQKFAWKRPGENS